MTTNSTAAGAGVSSPGTTETNDLFQRLRAPFPSDQISWRVGSRTRDKSRGQALPYIDARVVHNRLDEAVGPSNWKNELVAAPNGGGVMCILYIRVDGEWIGKSDVAQQDEVKEFQGGGGGADQNQRSGQDSNQKREIAIKGAVSDSLKRAAVLWGIGRYLYDYDAEWVALKDDGRYFASPPRLPDHMLPENERGRGRGQHQGQASGAAGSRPAPQRGPAPQGTGASSNATASSGASQASPQSSSSAGQSTGASNSNASPPPQAGSNPGSGTKISQEQWKSLDESVRKHVTMLSQRIDRRVDLPSVEQFITSGKGKDYPQWLKDALQARINEARASANASGPASAAAA
ncbi:MAG: Rad52/Rad22 family DNA repair protein [Terriglobia bacterium]|nr:Rad52/Rad22 family DNA repair protein [Terriglobia bacterium]